MGSKTEQPTAKRLRDAWNAGDLPISSFATQAISFVVAVALAPAAFDALVRHAASGLRVGIHHAADPTPFVDFSPSSLGGALVAVVTPLLAATAASAALAAMAQTGGKIGFKSAGARSTVSSRARHVWARRIVQFLRSILWIASVGALAYSMLRSHLRDLAGAEGQLVHVQAIGAYMTRGLAQQAAGVGFALAILDIVVTRVLWRSGLMMDRAEVERERRETEGDAQIKQERLRVDMGIALAALREAVGSASVVVTEGADRAAALRYDEHTNRERRPPILVASGRALVAHQIVDFAREFNISIVHAPKLARALCAAPPQSVVPESLYQDVALALRDAWAEHAPSRSEDA